jgi:hypothetical protein
MTGAVIVLAHASDLGAGLVAEWLAGEVGVEAVRIVRPEALSLAQWSHRVDRVGRATTSVTWPRKAPIEDSQVGAVLNRIRYLPVPRFRAASAKDRDYASLEFHAVVSSWLARFGERSVHAVRRHPVLTPELPLQHWASAAAACGLPVAAQTVASSARALRWRVGGASQALADNSPPQAVAGTVLVSGDHTGGALADRCGPQCRAAARALGFPLLEFRFATTGGEAVLVDVDPLPPLTEPWAAGLAGQLLASLAAAARP